VKSDERLLQKAKQTDPRFPGISRRHTTAADKTGVTSFTSTTLLSEPGMRHCTCLEQYEIHTGHVPDDPEIFHDFAEFYGAYMQSESSTADDTTA
jgi:hypothetical protein